MKLLDSTFLAHHARGSPDVERYLRKHEGEDLVTSAINVKEIAVGTHLVDDPTVESMLTDLRWVRILPFTAEHAYFAGELEAQLRENSNVRQDRLNSLWGDVLIAGVAMALDVPVVTRNERDFELFDDVDVEPY